MMENRISNRKEDYLRVIYNVIKRNGYARIRDVSHELDVHPSSACEMMKKLADKGLIVYEKYSGITLTSHGAEVAKAIHDRHKTFAKLLEMILVPSEIAQKDAHMLEHGVHPKTILQLTRFLVFISEECEGPLCSGIAMKDWRELFKNYCKWEDN
jgi:DtxR family Mn-dependent transcriptional regulator